jgi:3'-phosphoadenosine 5'-phosphosulfate (PAPS) 3'-phosphatase
MSAPGAFEKELAAATLAARRAAAAILGQRSHPVVSIKPDGSPVTSADHASAEVRGRCGLYRGQSHQVYIPE